MNPERAKEYLRRRISAGERYEDLLDFPRYFEIETVNACNARCPMCTIDDWQRHTPTMKDDLFAKISAEICARADVVKRVSLYRDGEPLLDKKMARRVKVLKDGGIRRVGISTNVSLLSEKVATDLLEAGLDEIVLSIDSLDKDVFEAIRVRLDFDVVMRNALRYIELRNKIRPQSEIWVRMIRQESNADEWPAYRAFWQPKLAAHDRCYYLNIHNWGGQLEGYKGIEETAAQKYPCVALWSLMVIFANGDVPMCNVDYNNKHPLGDLRNHSIAEVWQSRVQNERRRAHLEGRRTENEMCANCTVWSEPVDARNVAEEVFSEAAA